MSDEEVKTKFRGPGEWNSQAKELEKKESEKEKDEEE